MFKRAQIAGLAARFLTMAQEYTFMLMILFKENYVTTCNKAEVAHAPAFYRVLAHRVRTTGQKAKHIHARTLTHPTFSVNLQRLERDTST